MNIDMEQGYCDVSSWTKGTDNMFIHYDDLFALGYKYLQQYKDVKQLAQQSALDRTITNTMSNVQLIQLHLKSDLGQLVMSLVQDLPYNAVITGDELLFVPETNNWLDELTGLDFVRYAGSLGYRLEGNDEAV